MTIRIAILGVFIWVGSISCLQAQKFRYSVPGLDTLSSQFIVSGTASTVLANGQAEVIINNSMPSYWIAIHESGDNSPVLDRVRYTAFNADINAFYGVSPSGRFDLGIQLRYGRARIDNAASSSPFKVFEGSDLDADEGDLTLRDVSYAGLANVGLRFRYKPFTHRPEFVVNGGYAIATIKDEGARAPLGADRDFIDLGATYYKGLNSNVYYFFGASMRSYLPSQLRDEALHLATLNFFLIQRTSNQKLTFYPGISYSLGFKPSVYDDHPLIKNQEFLIAYGGVQYAINNRHNIFLTVGLPLLSEVVDPQQEIVRESYSIFALGARLGF